ncbi:MAG: KH domain-containing protein [Candidatus Obscuribacterales bacterium]
MGLILKAIVSRFFPIFKGWKTSGRHGLQVAGTREGITALQMDIKIEGISLEIMRVALEQAAADACISSTRWKKYCLRHREQLSKWAPRIITIHIEQDEIGTVIGPGGKNIRRIIEETGATIDIQDDGTVLIASVESAGGEAARDWIVRMLKKVQVGGIYSGRAHPHHSCRSICRSASWQGRHGAHLATGNCRVEKVEDSVAVGRKRSG